MPACLRARNLIVGAISGLPLVTLDADLRRVRVPLLEQIDPDLANVVTIARTVEDLLFESVAWWRVRSFGWDNFPWNAERIPVSRVHVPPVGRIQVDGVEVPNEELIRFDSPNPALLVYAARSLRRALKFEQMAEMYADTPRGLGYFSPDNDADPVADEDIPDLLADWDAARWDHSTGYVPAGLRWNSMDMMSPADLQLAQLQERAALDIANCTGLDPRDLGVAVNDRTYNNAQDRRQDRVTETLQAYMLAITGRLSMGDVTKRGQRVIFDLNDFMRADPKTRAEVAKTQIEVGALTPDEYRADEGRPPLTPEQKAAMPAAPSITPAADAGTSSTAAPAASAPGGTVQNTAEVGGLVALSAQAGEVVTVTFSADVEEFNASKEKRTVSGIVLPFGVETSDRRRLKFTPGSVTWNRSAVSQVKLDREHDVAQLLGSATEIRASDRAITGKFKIARTPAGDEALTLAEDGALDGLSAVVEIRDARPDPVDEGATLVTSAVLRRVTLTSDPAFSDARVTTVAASAVREPEPEGNTAMDDATTGQTAPAAPAAAPAIPAQASAPAIETEAFAAAVGTAVEAAFTRAVEHLGAMPTEQRQTVNPTRATVREPLVYSLNGQGASFVRDAWAARTEYGPQRDEALSRLRKYEAQTVELASAAATVSLANTGNTTDQAQIIPPGYRPDLYVGQIPQGRPLFQAMSRGTIANATPFKVPVWVGSANLSGPNSEGTGPSTGTITNHTYVTVSPTAQSGEFIISRELVDASNPAIDQIALAAMREEYAQDTEAVIATALAAATDNDTGSGQSTEGCYVYSVVGDGLDLAQKIRTVEAEFPFHRYSVAPNRLLFSSRGYGGSVSAVDGVGRPLFPYSGVQNSMGTTGDSAQSLAVDGLSGTPAWALTSGTDDVVLFNSVDAWAWESPLLTFRFEEKAGPESIVLNLWGYFGFQILRYSGIHSIAYTGV